jgi:hypothetical protein
MAAATVAKNLKDRRQRQALEEIFKKVNTIPVPCFWSPFQRDSNPSKLATVQCTLSHTVNNKQNGEKMPPFWLYFLLISKQNMFFLVTMSQQRLYSKRKFD